MFGLIFHGEGTFWEEAHTPLFDECIISWNAPRPEKTPFTIFVSLKQNGSWSPWIPYAEWGASDQKTFKSNGEGVHCYQDAIHPSKGFADGFRVRVEPEAPFFWSGSICQIKSCSLPLATKPLFDVELPSKPGHSQMALNHPLSSRICSPTSVVNVIQFLTKRSLDPISFASNVYDSGFDIYGNWILNVAAAFTELGHRYRCYVMRMSSFDQIHRNLVNGFPVIVSVRGPLERAPQPYSRGHLLSIVGYREGKVICIDPGFPTDEKTLCSYPLPSFLEAWNRRQNIAYCFHDREGGEGKGEGLRAGSQQQTSAKF